jgi:hypothetical protein
MQKVCPFKCPSEARSSMIDLSSPSLVGLGHIPGSNVTARKKLYAQRPTDIANERCVNA